MKTYDVIVIGTGGIGSAALYELARRGARAAGIDRFLPPHDRGSTHGHTRVIRQAYFEHPSYVPLLIDSYRRWHELEELVGQRLFHQVGIVEVGPPDGMIVPGVLRAANEHNLPVERVSAADISRRWPGLRAGAGLDVVYESRAGYLLVENCVSAHLAAARSAGADLLTDTEVTGWSANDGEVSVRTTQGDLIAGKLIVTAGAWAKQLLDELGLQLTVRRKSLFWFRCDSPTYDVANGQPVFFYELPSGVFYGFPKLDSRGVKVAEHSGGGSVADPLMVDREIDDDEQRRLIDFLSKNLPGVSPHVSHHTVCLYTMSPDEHFIIDRHPAHANVVFAAGLSGHGYKFATALGAALADLALDGRSALPIGFLSLSRFK
jgi:monomeric sarcosine oxidase